MQLDIIFLFKHVSFYSYIDPRTREWPMMSSPIPTLAICLGYAYFVKVSVSYIGSLFLAISTGLNDE